LSNVIFFWIIGCTILKGIDPPLQQKIFDKYRKQKLNTLGLRPIFKQQINTFIMDFGNIANAAQDLVKNAQGMMGNIDPNLVNQAEQMTGMDLNQDGSTGGAVASTLVTDSTSDEAVTAEESLAVETNDEVVE
jgi:hypothetical protein